MATGRGWSWSRCSPRRPSLSLDDGVGVNCFGKDPCEAAPETHRCVYLPTGVPHTLSSRATLILAPARARPAVSGDDVISLGVTRKKKTA